MALNMPTVFGKTDDDLKPRWQQSGSTLVNDYTSSAQDETLYTVTTGKIFYLASVVFSTAAEEEIYLLDGGALGISKLQIELAAGEVWTIVDFITPLQFSTDVYCYGPDSHTAKITLIGWEE